MYICLLLSHVCGYVLSNTVPTLILPWMLWSVQLVVPSTDVKLQSSLFMAVVVPKKC